jgi:putative transposase
MTERVQFMAAYLSQGDSMTDLGARVGLRRHTGYTWVRRSPEPGLVGLREKSRAPHHCPQRLAPEVAAALLEAKRAHPRWGPRTILPSLMRRRPALARPAPSTAGALVEREGRSHARKRRRGPRHPGAMPLQATVPTAVWTAACEGQFRTGDGLYG